MSLSFKTKSSMGILIGVAILVLFIAGCQVPSSGQAVTTGCTDSDAATGTNDYRTYGAVQYKGVVTSDVCQSSTKVTERYCKYCALASNNKPCSAPDTCRSKTVSLLGQQVASARCATVCQDKDQDGFQGSDYNGGFCELTTLADCKDNDPLVNPGINNDACDGIDNNCDGFVDDIGATGNTCPSCTDSDEGDNPNEGGVAHTWSIYYPSGESKSDLCISGKINEMICIPYYTGSALTGTYTPCATGLTCIDPDGSGSTPAYCG